MFLFLPVGYKLNEQVPVVAGTNNGVSEDLLPLEAMFFAHPRI